MMRAPSISWARHAAAVGPMSIRIIPAIFTMPLALLESHSPPVYSGVVEALL